ncbi:winged helix-turn-helix transcriptional regulator [Xenorhabdus thailandensis]|uniref:winged helix-turn-helix transcriptional regulator n=1 Tax=Xenorhabdus thailandensis TaxID=3136255 RepID=UPI0030F44339
MKKHTNFDCFLGCPVEAAISLLGGKWRGVIIYHIAKSDGAGFSELINKYNKLSRRTLSLQLHFLERKGIINKIIIKEKPLRIKYTLSKYGEELIPIFISMEDWFKNNQEDFLDHYDM